jgi:hypothetical protein
MSRMIEVTVSPTGETTVQTVCFVGGDCLNASKFLEEALGVGVSERKTAEFFETTANQQQIQQ